MSGHTVSSVDYVRGPIACMFVSVTSRFDLCRVCMESFCWSECFGMVQIKQILQEVFEVSRFCLSTHVWIQTCEYMFDLTVYIWASITCSISTGVMAKKQNIPRTFCIFWMFFTTQTFRFWYFNFTEKKIILTEISHSAKVTKHTIRINNPRTWEDSSVGERTWVQSLEYRHDIMHL